MKIGFFITARLKSSRLKQKILLDLNGKSVIDRVIERAKKVVGLDGVVLCTSTHSQDSVLFDYALSNHIQFYAGSENDVLKRLLDTAKYFGYDAFVSVTADNPLFCIHTSNILVDLYKINHYDFINTKGLPIGCNTYLIDVKTLEVINYFKNESDTEIWGPFINRPDFFNVADVIVDNSPFNEKLRITLDYPEDYNFIRNIYNYYNQEAIPSLRDVFIKLEENPKILGINKMHKQIMLTSEKLKEIDIAFERNKKKAIKYAKEIEKEFKAKYSKFKIVI